MGEGKARRIVEWLREHQDSIELQLGRHVAMPRSKLYAHELNAVVLPATDIRPLEKFIVPAELDGTRGQYRRPQPQSGRSCPSALQCHRKSRHLQKARDIAVTTGRRR